MRLRSITKHVKDQNWFAVALDFFIVVAGILIAFQITNWNEARQQKVSERDYLERLHSDIIELTERRSRYLVTRPIMNEALKDIAQFMNGDSDDLSAAKTQLSIAFAGKLSDEQAESSVCNMIDWSAALTIPPADLPTALELLSAGRVNDISSEDVRAGLLSFSQEIARSNGLISIVQSQTAEPSDKYPDLFTIRYEEGFGSSWSGLPRPKYTCDYASMKENSGFLNMLSKNTLNFAQYTYSGVLPVSEKLNELHASVDKVLGIEHALEEAE